MFHFSVRIPAMSRVGLGCQSFSDPSWKMPLVKAHPYFRMPSGRGSFRRGHLHQGVQMGALRKARRHRAVTLVPTTDLLVVFCLPCESALIHIIQNHVREAKKLKTFLSFYSLTTALLNWGRFEAKSNWQPLWKEPSSRDVMLSRLVPSCRNTVGLLRPPRQKLPSTHQAKSMKMLQGPGAASWETLRSAIYWQKGDILLPLTCN